MKSEKSNGFKKPFGTQKNNCANKPSWILMLNEINNVLGFSYARVSYRIGSSPSSVQKLMKEHARIPRDKMFFALSCYYHKLFYSETSPPKAKKYVEANQDKTLCHVVLELLNRGFLDDFGTTPNKQENKKRLFESAQQKGFLGKESVNVDPWIYKPSVSTRQTYII